MAQNVAKLFSESIASHEHILQIKKFVDFLMHSYFSFFPKIMCILLNPPFHMHSFPLTEKILSSP